MKKKLVIFGITELAQLAHFYYTHDSDYEVVAFVLDGNYIKENVFLGLPVVAFEDVEKQYPPNEYAMYTAIGYTNLSELRKIKFYKAKEKGYTLASYVSSKSTTWPGLKVGENTFIMEDFPDPVAPTKAMVCPFFTSNETWSKIFRLPS